jgi:formylglycine-generating enzyme required for sulfatase activity
MARVGLMAMVAGLLASTVGAEGETPAEAAVAQPGGGARAVPGQAWSLDLGGGVKMEFVWIEALKGWVGKYEVTNGEYRRFKPEHPRSPNAKVYHGVAIDGDRQPVCYVNYSNAVAFCQWVSATHAAQLAEGYTVRLPDGDEWTTFAQCGDGRKYPWGNEWPPRYGNFRDETGLKAFAHWQEGGVRIEGYDDGFAVSCPVEQSGKSEWGLYGVAGNVWELTAEISEGDCEMRGGSWHRRGEGCDLYGTRRQYPRVMQDSGVGFRVVALPAAAASAASSSASPNPGAARAEPQAAPALPGNHTPRSNL